MTTSDPPNEPDEDPEVALYRETCEMLRELIGTNVLLGISRDIESTYDWHPRDDPAHPNGCICPALMAYTLLYKAGYAIMPLDAAMEAHAALAAARARARNN